MGSILIAIHNQRVLTYMYIYVLTRLFAALFVVDFLKIIKHLYSVAATQWPGVCNDLLRATNPN